MILVTGATGFVGQALINGLIDSKKYNIRACSRSKYAGISQIVEYLPIGNISCETDWSEALQNVDVIIHTVARVHVMVDEAENPLEEFRKVNTDGTLNLARQAAEADVKRFIYLSSIKVNGEGTEPGISFSPNDEFIPDDPYGLSKYEAEQGLLVLAKKTNMEVVIIRPPLVYGPGVKANFASMMKWIYKGMPLPFGAVHNQRSLVAMDNLVSFIIHCIDHPKAANEVFMISDCADVSTTELLLLVASALGKKPRLIPIHVELMEFVAKLVGKESVANRLFGSLQVDSSKARDMLGWRPVVTMDEQLKTTVAMWLKERRLGS